MQSFIGLLRLSRLQSSARMFSDSLHLQPFNSNDTTNFARLTMDTPFKKAFADNKVHLLFLLRNVLRNDNIDIKSIDNVERKHGIDRNVFYDVICTLTSGTKIIIEMQNVNQRAQIVDRTVGYIARDYSEQWHKSTRGYNLTPVHLIALLNFTLDAKVEKSGSMVQGYTAAPKKIPGNRSVQGIAKRYRSLFDITLVQLPLAPAFIDDCKTDVERLCVLLRDSANFTAKTLPKVFFQEPFIGIAKCAHLSNLTSEQRDALAAEEDFLRTQFAHFESVTLERDEANAERDEANAEREKFATMLAVERENFASILAGKDAALAAERDRGK